jgi:AcrR family transcriptional regulator
LEAAEELFADQGFDAVSVRDITSKAGANVAAVNYHFGSRDELIAAVMVRYVDPVNSERLARLDALEAKFGSKGIPLEEIADAFVRPFMTQVRRSELSEKLFFKLMARTLAERGGKMPTEVEEPFRRVVSRFARAFAKVLPGMPVEDLLWRMHFMAGAMIHGMAHAETLHRLSNGASGNPTADATLARLIRFAAAGLRGAEGEVPELVAAKPRGPQSEFEF